MGEGGGDEDRIVVADEGGVRGMKGCLGRHRGRGARGEAEEGGQVEGRKTMQGRMCEGKERGAVGKREKGREGRDDRSRCCSIDDEWCEWPGVRQTMSSFWEKR